MPFTVSHTIVALPFRGRALPAAAVAVGAMTPDTVLFVPGIAPYAVTHSPLGALTVALPIALVVLGLWTFGIRAGWTAVQAPGVRDRLPAAWADPGSAWRASADASGRTRASRLALTVLGAALGVATHITWDAFTHPHGAATLAFPVLRDEVLGHAVYSLLQDASSAAGVLVLAVAWLRWRRRTPARASGPSGRNTASAAHSTTQPGPVQHAGSVWVVPERVARPLRIGTPVAAVIAAAAWTVPLIGTGADVPDLGAVHLVQCCAVALVLLAVVAALAARSGLASPDVSDGRG